MGSLPFCTLLPSQFAYLLILLHHNAAICTHSEALQTAYAILSRWVKIYIFHENATNTEISVSLCMLYNSWAQVICGLFFPCWIAYCIELKQRKHFLLDQNILHASFPSSINFLSFSVPLVATPLAWYIVLTSYKEWHLNARVLLGFLFKDTSNENYYNWKYVQTDWQWHDLNPWP